LSRKLNKKKIVILACTLLIIFSFLISEQHTINAKADSNYSNYLTSESISVKNDRALILLESSGSSNNYRNYFETSFLFPSKLRNEMYSTYLTTNPSKYYTQQVYLNDLDNDYAFKSVENLGQYETNDYIENYTDIIENNGNFVNYNSEIESNGLSTIGYSGWYILPFSELHIAIRPAGTIMAMGVADENLICHCFMDNLNDYPMSYIVNSITVNVHGKRRDQDGYISDDVKVQVLSNNYTSENIVLPTTLNVLSTSTQVFSDLNIYGETLEYISLKITAPSDIAGDSSDGSYYIITNAWLIFDITIIEKVLQESDFNYYNYISNGSGIAGNFPAEYSFELDSNGSNPSGWNVDEGGGTINVISDFDSHNKVLEFNDINTNDLIADQIYSNQNYGTIEFWILDNDADDSFQLYVKDGTTALCGVMIDGNKFRKYDNGGWSDLGLSANDNTWYHILIDFECSSSSYKGLNQYKFKIAIDGTYYGSEMTFMNTRSQSNKVEFRSGTTEANYISYLDAIDYSWSVGYYENRNRYDSSYSLNITSNLQLNRLGNSFDNLESLELEYTFKTNNTSDLELYLKNIDSNNYDLIDSNEITTSFQEFSYSFVLNYTYYSTTGIIDFMFYIENTNNLLISIDKINLKAIFSNFSINDLGYHNINIEFNRKTSGSVNRGNISLNLQLYKTNFTYDYIENNVIESDYSKLNQFVDFSNGMDEIQEVEIQAHIRYGLNTLDIDIVNIYYKVIINYNYTFELYEQLRNGNNDGNYFRAFFSYDSMNFNRLNNTGIFGNYSTNCLSGLRVLRGSTDINYNRYFIIPYFDEKITLSYAPSGVAGSGTGSEPRQPSGTYWTYETYKLSDYGITVITVENWSVDFRTVYAEKYEAKYYYRTKTIKRSDLGSWHFKIGDIKVSFNFIRNAVADIINLILLFFQYIFFLVTASLSYILMYLGVNIIVLLWNIVVFYCFIALIWVLWYFYLALFLILYYIWEGLVWVYENLLVPFIDWCRTYLLPILLDYFIMFWAGVIAVIIWLATFGTADLNEIYNAVYKMLWQMTNFFIEMILIFIKHIDAMLMYVFYYLLLCLLCFVKYGYTKARGFVNRCDQLKYSFDAYMIPVNLIVGAGKKIWDMMPEL